MNLADPLFVKAEVAYRLERAHGGRHTDGWLNRRAARRAVRRAVRRAAEPRAAVTPITAGLSRGASVLSAARHDAGATGARAAARTFGDCGTPAEETPRAS